jgi:S1-C subfamily serine protease
MQSRCALLSLYVVLAPFFLYADRLPAAPDGALQPTEVLRLIEQARIGIFQIAAPSVVILGVELAQNSIEAETETDSVPKRPTKLEPLRSEGSGFVVRSNGVLVTNLHVVAQARRIVVRFKDGRRLDARILGSDERTDIAVLQVDASNLVALPFADSDAAAVGQFVCAIGVPFGQEWSFTSGLLSGKGRSRLLAPKSLLPLYEDYLQTDAVINPGHSGGPLLDSAGHVLGMNTLIARVEHGLAFAVPSNLLQQTVAQILETGKVTRPWLGIRAETLGETVALRERLAGAQSGVVVLAIEMDGPAFKTDLRPADVIQALDGAPVNSALELQRALFERKTGQTVTADIWRQGVRKAIKITLAQLPEAPQTVVEPERNSRTQETVPDKVGLTLKELKGRGVRVEAVAEGSQAAKADLQLQDIITEVEGRSIHTVAECMSALRSGSGRGTGTGVLIQVERMGRRTFVLWR